MDIKLTNGKKIIVRSKEQYEANLNHVFYGIIWKPVDYKWHIFGYDIPWFGGKKSLILVVVGVVIILLGIFWR